MGKTVQYFLKPGAIILKKVCDSQQYYFTTGEDCSMHSETFYYRFNEESLGPEGKGDRWIQVGEEEMIGAKLISHFDLMEYLYHKDWLAWNKQRDEINAKG